MKAFVVVVAGDGAQPDALRAARRAVVSLGHCEEPAPGVWFLVPWKQFGSSEALLEEILALGVNHAGPRLIVSEVSNPAVFDYPSSIFGGAATDTLADLPLPTAASEAQLGEAF